MGNELADLDRKKEVQANALARETGITVDEALMLIELVGPHRGAMLRVARIVQAQKSGGSPAAKQLDPTPATDAR